VEVLSRARDRGYHGGKSALYDLVKELRPRTVPPLLVRFEGVPGEFSQHDFGHVRATFTDGSHEQVTFFVSRLKYSRWAHVIETPDEKVEALVRALLAGFEDFGGVPLASVFDNTKTIVVSRTAGKPDWNPTFGQMVLDYGFSALLCTPRRPQEKGTTENLVGWVKSGFWSWMRCLVRCLAQCRCVKPHAFSPEGLAVSSFGIRVAASAGLARRNAPGECRWSCEPDVQ
jgi:transposase